LPEKSILQGKEMPMKLGRLLFGLSLWLLLVGTPVLADEVAERLESIVVESFDDPDVRQWTEEGAQLTEDRRWTVVGSKFSARIEDEETGEIEVYPQIAFPETWPTALISTITPTISTSGSWVSGPVLTARATTDWRYSPVPPTMRGIRLFSPSNSLGS
jgi:hypothetical protein